MEDHFDFCHVDRYSRKEKAEFTLLGGCGPLCPGMPKFSQKSLEEYLGSPMDLVILNDPRLKY